MPSVRTGPVTKDTTAVPLGLAQIRVGNSAANITKQHPVLTGANSIGALANTKLMLNAEYYKLLSGYPKLTDATFPLSESASVECAFLEWTPANFALARGLDPAGYPNNHSGIIKLGTMAAPIFIRMEAVYTYPNMTDRMIVIFPRGQVSATVEAEWQAEEPGSVPITIESQRADSEMAGGNSAWDDKPLGQIMWDTTAKVYTTTSTTTTTTA
jgi:hypothetical protein